MKKKNVDIKLLIGFGSLIVIIIIIGLIGLFQIYSLTNYLDQLVQKYYPMHNAALEMKINNGLYIMGIRNYVFWKHSRYIESAKAGTNLKVIEKTKKEFDQQLKTYLFYVKTKTWPLGIKSLKKNNYIQEVGRIEDFVLEMRATGDKLIKAVEEDVGFDHINKLLMTFEFQAYKINNFIDVSLQEFNFSIIKDEIRLANLRTANAIFLIKWVLVLGVLIGGRTSWLVYSDRKKDKERMVTLAHKMIALEEKERKTLSLQVHDQMGQDLSALRIYIDLIDKEIPKEDTMVKDKIVLTKEILSGLMKRMHNISEMLRPPALDEIGLIHSIGGLIVQYEQMTNIKFVYRNPEKDIVLSEELSLCLYRVVQEALTNVIKYSRAKNVKVDLKFKNNLVFLEIKDDGVGFNYKRMTSISNKKKDDKIRLGIEGLKERVEILGGEMSIKASPGKGVKLIVEFSLSKA